MSRFLTTARGAFGIKHPWMDSPGQLQVPMLWEQERNRHIIRYCNVGFCLEIDGEPRKYISRIGGMNALETYCSYLRVSINLTARNRILAIAHIS